jgi:competence protein ComEC
VRVAGEAKRSRAAVALLRERPYHAWLSSFACGLGCAASAPRFALLAAALALVALVAVRAPTHGLVCAGLVLGAATLGSARLAAIDAPARRLATASRIDVRADLLERPRHSPFGSRAEVRIVFGPARGARLLARAPRTLRWPRNVATGAELRLHGFVRRPRSRPGAEFDFAAYLRRRGIAGELWLDSVEATGRRRGGSAGVFDAIRRRAERALEAGMSPREAALARGMVLGQDERIDAPTREDWRAAGLAHLLVVSGQNVTLLAALAAPLLIAAGLGLRSRALALLFLIVVYVPVAGAGPSLQRAGVMGAAGIGAMMLSRPASRWYVLLLAAVATLAVNPRSWTDPAWQLSFAAVTGILCVGPSLAQVFGATLEALFPGRSRPAARRPLLRAVAEASAITVAATLATAPLLAHHFGSVSVAGLPANLLALPAVVPAMWLGMAKAGLGQLAALGPPFDALADTFATALGAIAQIPVAYLAVLAERIASLPFGQVTLPLASR